MPPASPLFRGVALTLSLALAACVNPGAISAQNRAAIRVVRMTDPPDGVLSDDYSDATSRNMIAGIPALGVIGAGVAMVDIYKGVKRWEPVTAGHRAQVLELVREQVARRFVETGKLRIASADPVDARLELVAISYGVSHVKDQRFQVAISAEADLKTSIGEVVWRKTATAKSTAPFTLAEYQKHPQTFNAGIEEAVGKLAEMLVAGY